MSVTHTEPGMATPPGGKGPIRVALCITDLAPGGAERAMAELATRLDRARFQVRVYGLMTPPADAAQSIVPTLAAADVPVRSFGARRFWHLPRVERQLRADWEAWQPHLVQTFLFHANVLGARAARAVGVRHVVSGIRVAEQRGGWRLRVERKLDRYVDRHVCVSQAVADFAAQRAGLPREKLVVIPNGVDPARFDAARPATAAELRLPQGRRWITYVGRLDRQKGLDWLLHGARAWLDRLPEHDLLLVGAGPQRRALERIAQRAGVAGNQEFTRWKSDAPQPADRTFFLGWRGDVPGILAASDLVILPSRWEGMPNAVLEAMAARRAVLATDVEGVRELLGDDAAQQVVPPGDQRAWAERIVELAENRTLAAQLGERNRRRVEGHFTLASMVRRYEMLYDELVAMPQSA